MGSIIEFKVDGRREEVIVNPEDTLLEVLRDKLNLNSPKCGCNRGDCGACTVIMDGKAVKSCAVLAISVGGSEIYTAEGLGSPEHLHPVQQAFLEYGAPQCGYCTPGMVTAAVAFLDENPKATREEIKDALAGNLCRCGGYKEYLDALDAVVAGEYGPLPERRSE